jgi:hypothetical protein
VKRREFITLLGGDAAAWPLAARNAHEEDGLFNRNLCQDSRRSNMSFHGLKRGEFIGLLGAAAACPTSACGQTRKKDPTIGVLWHAADAEEEKYPLSLFRQGMQDVGYVEGQNIEVRHKTKGARDWFERLRRANPSLFAHWQLCHGNGRTSGAV